MTRSELTTFIARRHHDLPAADIELAVNLIIKTISGKRPTMPIISHTTAL